MPMPSLADVLRMPGVARLMGSQVLARLPQGMLSIAVIMHVQAQVGNYTEAGLTVAAFSLGAAVSGPLLGRWMVTLGARRMLGFTLLVNALGTVALGLAPASIWAYLPIAAAMGLTNPPILPIVRSIYPKLVPAGMTGQVFSLDSVAQEFIWVVGPVLVTVLVPLLGSTLTLVTIAGIGALGGVLLFTADEMRTARFTASEKRLGSVLLKWPVLIAVLTATLQNMAYGATETAVVGVFHGDELEAGLVLAVFALGSMAGGLLTARTPMRPWSMASRQVILALGTIAAAAIPTVWWMGACLFLAGFGTASSLAVVYNVVSSSLKAADSAEAFGWLGSGLLGGIAVGSAISGAVIDQAGPVIAILVSGVLAVCAALLPALGVRVLPDLAVSSGPRLDTTAIPVIRRPKL